MTLQKDLSVYKLLNRMIDEHAPEKYEYQLFNKSNLVTTHFSDINYHIGVISTANHKITLDLFKSISEVNIYSLEEYEVFIVNVIEL